MSQTIFPSLLRTLAASLMLAQGAAMAQALPGVEQAPPVAARPGETVQSGGSETIGRFLEAISPGVDTSIPPSASQVSAEIERLLDAGQTAEAMKRIQQRLAEEAERHDPGIDVQLQFLYARALQAEGQTARAQEIYRDMTLQFPELPEPWNNLAALYWRAGKLDLADEALQMALTADPNYALAWANLADVRLAQADAAYERAQALGMRGLERRREALRNLSQPKSQP